MGLAFLYFFLKKIKIKKLDTVACECTLIRTGYNIYFYIYIYSQLREQEGGLRGGGRRLSVHLSDISLLCREVFIQQGDS